MSVSRSTGPGGYAEVSGTPGTPHPAPGPAHTSQAATPFTPPDTSALGYGASAGGTAQNRGGGLADQISGTGGMGGKLIKLFGGAEEGGEAAAAAAAL